MNKINELKTGKDSVLDNMLDEALEGHQIEMMEIKDLKPEDENDMKDFDEMFVKEEEVSEHSVTHSVESHQNNKTLHQETTKGIEQDKLSFHGTKGDYYDEYLHQKYTDRSKNI
eukprot:105637_1